MQLQRDQPRFGVADVVREHGAAFLAAHGRWLTHAQVKALADIERCRTAALGGHVEVYACGHEVIAYNSCRNRSCPKCLGHKAREWVEKKERDLLPVPYFHVVFTLPHELTQVPVLARAALYEALFRASAATLREVGRRRLGGELGFLSVLHTWGQTLTHHPHVHCVVAGGALSEDRRSFHVSKARFLLPVSVLSLVFKAKMLDELRRLPLPGVEPAELALLIDDAARKKWVVYAKPPFGGPAQVLRYLARYTHKIAISDRRIVDVNEKTVFFTYKDYRHGNEAKVMRLHGNEWLRRFTTHVLPRGFVRLRGFGFLANAKKAERLEGIRALLGAPAPAKPLVEPERPACTCPVCGCGALVERRALGPITRDTS
jgi:hypothetical protein